jgi:His/Glu/Gln/Arg/opine family amino acid ABC transporter permease subunit
MRVWNWEGFFSYFTNPYLLEGALVTLFLTISTLALGFVLGLGITLLRMSSSKALNQLAKVYVWIFRGTPLLVQLIIIYTGLPQLGLVRLSVFESAIIGRLTCRRSCAAASCPSARARGMRPAPSDSTGARRSCSSPCRRRCVSSSRRSATL